MISLINSNNWNLKLSELMVLTNGNLVGLALEFLLKFFTQHIDKLIKGYD